MSTVPLHTMEPPLSQFPLVVDSLHGFRQAGNMSLNDDSSRFLADFAGHPAQSVASVDAVAVDRQTQLTLADPHHGFGCVFLVFRNPVEHETVAPAVLFETLSRSVILRFHFLGPIHALAVL